MSQREGGLLGVSFDILRGEGFRAVLDRALDRFEEKRRQRRIPSLDAGDTFDPPPVLNLSPVPLSPKRGGAQIQLIDRLEIEGQSRTVAIANPTRGSIDLEIRTAEKTRRASLEAGGDFSTAISDAARLVRTNVVHIENINGLSMDLIESLSDRGLETVLSVHDFTLFCRKPHLIERTTGRFCEYSRDEDRCHRCLGDTEDWTGISQNEYRRTSARARTIANAVVYPSEFLRRFHQDTFADTGNPAHELVIPPATRSIPPSSEAVSRPPAIAFLGGCHAHKGAALIRPTMELIHARKSEIQAIVYGSGDHDLGRGIRSLQHIRVRGYYRQGRLPSLLARDNIRIAVLASIWPEAYGLVVDECLASGVPVVAFDHGAVGERLKRWNTGTLVSPDAGAEGLAQAVLEGLQNGADVSSEVIRAIPTPGDAARMHLELYDALSSKSL